MAMTVTIPLLSATAGETSEGICIGGINESSFIATLSSVNLSVNRKVYRLDRSGGSLNIIDDTTNATSGTPNAFSPFGTNVIPASATLKVYDSTDGVWATNPLTVTASNSSGGAITNPVDCLKSTGWCRLSFGENSARSQWRPSLDPAAAIPARKYIRFELDDAGDKDSFIVACGSSDLVGVFINVTTAGGTGAAVKLAEVVLIRRPADVKYFNFTSRTNGDTNVSLPPLSATYQPVRDAVYPYCFSNRAYGFEDYVQLRSSDGPNIAVYSRGNPTASISGASASGSSSGTAAVRLGDTPPGGGFHTGRIYEFAFFRGVLTADERQRLAAYALWAVGEQAQINASNTYRLAAPTVAL